MKSINKFIALAVFVALLIAITVVLTMVHNSKVSAQTLPNGDINLSTPDMDGGMPLMKALKNRRTGRDFSSDQLSEKILTNLLWAANGVNRDDGKRTAPTARNKQEIDIYVLWNKNAYFYDTKNNKLEFIKTSEISSAPVELVYVADLQKQSEMLSGVDCGFIGQNVYLFCASNNLNTVFKGSVDRESLAKELKLTSDQKVMYTQEVGYPAKN